MLTVELKEPAQTHSAERLMWCRQRRSSAITREPTHHVELRAHPIRRLGSGAVEFPIEAQHRRRNAAVFECLVELLALRNGRAPIEFAGHEQSRCLHVADMHQG